jgi:uncharacterized membrane protein YfcA
MAAADLFPALAAGGAVDLVLALVGGGGSIIAVPLLVYLVGIGSPHMAIGTAAVSVAINAAIGLAGHARRGNVKWPCAMVFALFGAVGAVIGAEAGKATDGTRLLALFGAMMVVVGVLMLRGRKAADNPDVRLERDTAVQLLPRLIPAGFGTGLLAGFFGIGGGFLIVPALVFATCMPLSTAVGTSLVAVTALGMTTASSYALSGLVDWRLVGLMVAGGLGGVVVGIALGRILSGRRKMLERGFAMLVMGVGIYIAVQGLV